MLRRFLSARFSLRMALLAMTLVCMSIAALRWHIGAIYTQGQCEEQAMEVISERAAQQRSHITCEVAEALPDWYRLLTGESVNTYTALELPACHLAPAEIAAIAKLRNLTSLKLLQCGIDDADVEVLASLSRLEVLELGSDQDLTDAGLRHLGKLPALRELQILDCGATLQGLQAISSLHQLTRLVYRPDHRAKEDALPPGLLGCFPDLSILILASEHVHDGDLAHLPTGLTFLYLRGSVFTDAAVERLVKCDDLITVFLSESEITDEGLLRFARLTKLTRLSLGSDFITDAGIERLRQANPGIRVDRPPRLRRKRDAENDASHSV